MKPALEVPSEKRKDSYLAMLDEFRVRGEPFVPFVLGFPTDDFADFLRQTADCAKGLGIPEGFVPHETFWLIADDSEVVAVSNLRHHLTASLREVGGQIGFGVCPSARRRGHATAVLTATLEKARIRGLTKVLLTCDKGNLGSEGAILNNEGVFESEERMDGHETKVQRYWIKL